MANSLIRFVPGINPEPDETKQNTRHLIDGNHIRFYRGGVEKLGGHSKEAVQFVDLEANTLSQTAYEGCARGHFSYFKDGRKWQVIGTSTHLYAKLGGTAYNITPLKTTATATLGANPLSVTNGDETVTVAYTAHDLEVGDRIKLSGATDVGGITAATDINIEHIVSTVPNANSFTIEVSTQASSTASGGGASVEIYKQIDAGECHAVNPTGPGIGTPGLGLPGSIQTDTTLFEQPRIWWFDLFGTTLVCGPGQGGKAYQWNSDTASAPVIITNAPAADIGWVENAKLVIFLDNVLYNSDVGSLTSWTPGAASSAYEDTKEDARQIIGRAYANGENLIFDEDSKLFRLRWVGGSVKWIWERLDYKVGIMGPNAHISVGGVIYIFARDNVYYYSGGVLAPVPGGTLLKYVYQNINIDQRFKFFAWFNGKPWYEIHLHYASGDSIENDRAVVISLTENWWAKREGIERSAADTGTVFDYPILCSPHDGTYQHETGYDDDTAAMNAFVQVAYDAIGGGEVYTEITGMEPDLVLTGSATVELYGKDRSMDDGVLLQSFTVTNATSKLDCDEEARWRSWLLRSNELGGFFRWGGMREFVKPGSEF